MSVHGGHIAYAFTLSLLSVFVLVLVIALFFLCRKKRVHNQCGDACSDIRISARIFSLSEIDVATDGFNPRRIIGKGRLGTTYVGVLDKGEVVAVKRIHPWLVLSKAGLGLGFQSMIRSLALAQNPHIVPIIGFSEAPGERIILMEYVGTMSLEFYLHQHVDGPSILGWVRRLNIAVGVARGLDYLHEKTAPQVVHGCIKPSNVLIDVKFNARVCDFGLSFLASQQEKMGIIGYVDEEYWEKERKGGIGACKESDVYGFGVVLLELLSGRSNEEGLLVEWALPLVKEMKFTEFLDPRLPLPSNMKPLGRLAKVASACVGNSRKTRPKISEIVEILNSLSDIDLRL
uniref:Receptor protein serine/threonine kinase n=1 Tax=Opuntia streptacantha TaxID=393608 RepID=A0A7C9E3F6_OPUST